MKKASVVAVAIGLLVLAAGMGILGLPFVRGRK